MDALKQYIDLYDEHRELIDANSTPALNRLRAEARLALDLHKLPRVDTDNYENCDLEAMLSPDYGINIARIPMDVNPDATFRCDVPLLSSHLVMSVNDIIVAGDNTRSGLPENVEIGSLRDFARSNPDIVNRYYGGIASLDNPVVALNTMLAQDGIFIRIPDDTVLDRPLQITNIIQSDRPLMSVRRVLIIAGKNSSARLLACDHTQNPDCDFLSLQTIEIFAEENAEFHYYDLEESSRRTGRISALYVNQGKGSNVVVDGMTLFNGNTRNEYYCRLNGEDASLRLLGMGIEDDGRCISTYSHIDHNVPRCHSDELFKFTIDDNARAAFTGRIYVAPGAVGTEAYQSNRNLVGSDTARMTSKPELEIYNDDVKCSHGSAIGQLDPMEVFYMRTRGIDEATARLLLKQAFMADIIDAIEVESLRDRLRMLVERRYAGLESACAKCPVGCK